MDTSVNYNDVKVALLSHGFVIREEKFVKEERCHLFLIDYGALVVLYDRYVLGNNYLGGFGCCVLRLIEDNNTHLFGAPRVGENMISDIVNDCYHHYLSAERLENAVEKFYEKLEGGT